MGAPKWPPNPQRSEAPRPRRGAPRAPASGPEMAPKPPAFGSAPATPWRSSGTRERPRNGPQTPSVRKRPGQAVALLGHPRAAPKWPPNPQRSEAPRPRRGAPRPYSTDAGNALAIVARVRLARSTAAARGSADASAVSGGWYVMVMRPRRGTRRPGGQRSWAPAI